MASVVQDKNRLLQTLWDNRNKIKSFGVVKLSLFGSFAGNAAKESSDVDFLVEFDPELKNYDNFIELSFYLEDLLGRKVELVTRQALSKYIGPHILKQAEYVAI
jgi:predicted nucleotidyltransferase